MPKHNPEMAKTEFKFMKDEQSLPLVDKETGEITETHKMVKEPLEELYQVEFRKLKNSANAVPKGGIKITDPSLTVPDQSMTIKEILRRNAQGLTMGDMAKIPQYDGAESPDDLVLPDLSKVDLADRQAILDEYEDMLRDITDRLKKQGKYAPEEIKKPDNPGLDPAKEDLPPADPKNTNIP